MWPFLMSFKTHWGTGGLRHGPPEGWEHNAPPAHDKQTAYPAGCLREAETDSWEDRTDVLPSPMSPTAQDAGRTATCRQQTGVTLSHWGALGGTLCRAQPLSSLPSVTSRPKVLTLSHGTCCLGVSSLSHVHCVGAPYGARACLLGAIMEPGGRDAKPWCVQRRPDRRRARLGEGG